MAMRVRMASLDSLSIRAGGARKQSYSVGWLGTPSRSRAKQRGQLQ